LLGIFDGLDNPPTFSLASDTLTYRQFRKTAEATFGMDAAVVVPWCGMWLAIEADGYVHS
jgi:hypothetical protein